MLNKAYEYEIKQLLDERQIRKMRLPWISGDAEDTRLAELSRLRYANAHEQQDVNRQAHIRDVSLSLEPANRFLFTGP